MAIPLKCRTDGQFTILQVSDPQDLHFVRRTMFRMLNRAYDRVQPDLIVFTGDNVLGNHLGDARFGHWQSAVSHKAIHRRMRRAIRHLLRPIERRAIPFAYVLGNHDDMNCLSAREIAEIYAESPGLAGWNADNPALPPDTCLLPIQSSDGRRTVSCLWLFNSAGCDDAGTPSYAYVSAESVRWFEETSERLRAENGGGPVPSLAFQHIPLPETMELLEKTTADDPEAVPMQGRLLRLNRELASGRLKMDVHACVENFGEFQAFVRQGGVMAVATGHDHRNCFVGHLQGIDLVQTPCASFRCYSEHMRAVRVFRLQEQHPNTYQTDVLTYEDLMGNGWLSRLRYFWDADETEEKKARLLRIAALTATGVAVAVAAALLLLR